MIPVPRIRRMRRVVRLRLVMSMSCVIFVQRLVIAILQLVLYGALQSLQNWSQRLVTDYLKGARKDCFWFGARHTRLWPSLTPMCSLYITCQLTPILCKRLHTTYRSDSVTSRSCSHVSNPSSRRVCAYCSRPRLLSALTKSAMLQKRDHGSMVGVWL